MSETAAPVRPPMRKERVGRVVSAKMQKTVVVEVRTTSRHRLYKRTVFRRERYKVHDETNACTVGDVVRIVETRPLSKDKRWRISEIVQKSDAVLPVNTADTE